MSKRSLKLFGLLAVLIMAGTAWASVTGRLFTPSGTATNFAGAAALGQAANVDVLGGAGGFELVNSGTQTATVTLPTAAEVRTAQTNPAVTNSITSNLLAYNHWQPDFDFNAVVGPDKVWGAAILLDATETLTIRPGSGFNITQVTTPPATPGVGNIGIGGLLRLHGGVTNLWAGNGNDPVATVTNNYDAGTFLMAGRLNLAHSLSVGRGPITLAHNTTLGVIETNNLDLGGTIKEGESLTNPGMVGIIPSGKYHQNIVVRRYDNNTTDGVQNVRPVTFDVPTVLGKPINLRIYSGITQPIFAADVRTAVGGDGLAANGQPVAPDFFSVRVEKTGAGEMNVFEGGMRHTGGTHVKEGRLFVDGGQTNKFGGEVGRTWLPDDSVAHNPHVNNANEAFSAKTNYNMYLARLALPAVWDVRTGAGTGTAVPAYMNTFTLALAANTAVDRNPGYVNPLTIDAGATLAVNRDQFIGDFNGAGRFEPMSWIKATTTFIPQLTMHLNNSTSPNGGNNAVFSGVIDGEVNLVLDNPVAVTGNGNSVYPRIQALTGENRIASGDTFIKDGALSISGSNRIGPDPLIVGMHPGGYIHNGNGVGTGTATFRGFVRTATVATFHGSSTFTVAQPTTIYAVDTPAHDYTVGTGQYNFPVPFVNLAATRGNTVSFPQVTLVPEVGAVATIVQVANQSPIRYSMTEALSINDKLHENTNWAGTIAFTDVHNWVGTMASRKAGFDVKNGVLHFETLPVSGYGLVGIRQGATLSLGAEARDFEDSMTVIIEDDARIRVRPQATDLTASLVAAQASDAVFMADEINYTGLGMGTEHKDKRLVIQLDLADVANSITDQWIKVVGSHNAPNWNNIHYYPESGSGQNEHLYKVKVARPDGTVFDGNYQVTAYADENEYNIYVHIKKLDAPVPTDKESLTATLTAEVSSARPGQDITFDVSKWDYKDLAGNVTADVQVTYEEAVLTNMTKVSDKLATDGTYVAKVNANAANGSTASVSIVATYTKADGTKFTSQPVVGSLTVSTGSSSDSSGGGGCDAGFAGLALLLAAPLFLRKRD